MIEFQPLWGRRLNAGQDNDPSDVRQMQERHASRDEPRLPGKRPGKGQDENREQSEERDAIARGADLHSGVTGHPTRSLCVAGCGYVPTGHPTASNTASVERTMCSITTSSSFVFGFSTCSYATLHTT